MLRQHDQVEAVCDGTDALVHTRVAGLQAVVLPQVEGQQVLQVERVEALGVVVVVGVAQELPELVLPGDLPGQRGCAAEVVEGGLEELGGVPQDGHIGRVGGQQLGHLGCVEAHVVTHDVEAHARLEVLHLRALEECRVEEVVPAVGEGELESVLLAEAEQDVDERAAGRLVGLHEHDVHLGAAERPTGPGIGAVGGLQRVGGAVGTRVRHGNPVERDKMIASLCFPFNRPALSEGSLS